MNEYPKSADTLTETVVGGRRFVRVAISSPASLGKDSPEKFALKYGSDRVRADDILVFSAQAIAIYQKNYYLLTSVKPSFIAEKISKMVKKGQMSSVFSDARATQAGIAELGLPRFLVGALMERFFKKGYFSKIIGEDGRLMDLCVVDDRSVLTLCPDDLMLVVENIAEELGVRTVIADLRRDARVIAMSESSLDTDELEEILHDAPMRVGNRRVPMAIVREN